jgi:alpha-mannosidase
MMQGLQIHFLLSFTQAQQYSWIKEYYPSLFNEIRRYVQEGRFIPVGATWIEMDGNIPR